MIIRFQYADNYLKPIGPKIQTFFSNFLHLKTNSVHYLEYAGKIEFAASFSSVFSYFLSFHIAGGGARDKKHNISSKKCTRSCGKTWFPNIIE